MNDPQISKFEQIYLTFADGYRYYIYNDAESNIHIEYQEESDNIGEYNTKLYFIFNKMDSEHILRQLHGISRRTP